MLPNYNHIYDLLRLLLGFGVLRILDHFIAFIPFSKQGFFCDDDEIRYPFHEDTVPFSVMQITYLIVGIVTVICVEWSLIRHITISKNQRLCRHQCGPLHPVVYHFLFFILTFVCVFEAADVVANFGKRTMSRLRPNFLAVCRPEPTCVPGSHVFVSEYTCAGDASDEYASFPSGHAACAVSFAVLFIYYVHRRSRLPQPLSAFTQLAIALFALFVCLSRVRDHKHRLVDVLAGATVGAIVAVFTALCVLRGFRGQRYVTELKCFADFDTRRVVPTVVVHEPSARESNMTSAYGSIDERGSFDDN